MFTGADSFKAQEVHRHRGRMRFRNRQLCERETFVLSNGFHHFCEAVRLEPVQIDSEIAVCEWPRK
jgi:hypothetical protein